MEGGASLLEPERVCLSARADSHLLGIEQGADKSTRAHASIVAASRPFAHTHDTATYPHALRQRRGCDKACDRHEGVALVFNKLKSRGFGLARSLY